MCVLVFSTILIRNVPEPPKNQRDTTNLSRSSCKSLLFLFDQNMILVKIHIKQLIRIRPLRM